MTGKEYADGLRAIASWYEAHPEIPLPADANISNAFCQSKDDAAAVIRALGKCQKEYSEKLLTISRKFGQVTAQFLFWRDQVCVRKVVGTREIPEQKIEAHTIPASVEEIVEWDCQPILSTEKEQKAA